MKKILIIILLTVSINAFAQRDTVKIIMLISDTSEHHENKNYTYFGYGYTVKELKNSLDKDSSVVICCHTYWEYTSEYFDEKKNKLPENIIVWDFREVTDLKQCDEGHLFAKYNQ